MDESWRMRMGMPSTAQLNHHHHRRSTEDISHHRWRSISGDSNTILLEPEDFNDVFGGPPRIIMSRKFSSCNNFSKTLFNEDVFQPPGKVGRDGRVLPEFRIPQEKGSRRNDDGFYSDIFGCDEDEVRRFRTRSGTKSKASSSSALSSEELSPLQTAVNGGGGRCGDDDVPLFASRLRPINVPSRWNSTKTMLEVHNKQQEMPISWNNFSYHVENDFNDNFRSSHSGFCPGNSSPETINLEPNAYRVVKTQTPVDDFIPNSPSSAVSSICQEQESMAAYKARDEIMQDQGMDDLDEDEEDEVMNSYVIEINSEIREGTDDAICVDDAIAWAKAKFQQHCSENTEAPPQKIESRDKISERRKIDGHGVTDASEIEMKIIEENVRLWSTGKETNIRLLLSTMHHILWINSGWIPIPLGRLTESSHLKKAYQKARLCLHPDKLQQRGATFSEKYVAKRVFSVIQEAWDAFVSEDVS